MKIGEVSKSRMTKRSRGFTLVVAIILLLVITIFSLFALNVGVFEQRTSGNDFRARMVNKTAEMAVSQGIEYLNANRDAGELASGNWVPCDADEEKFPCGAVPQTVEIDGVEIAYRGNMYRFDGGTQDFDGGGIGAVDKAMLPLTGKVADIGGFALQYGVGALLCRIQRQDPRPNPLPVGYVAPPARCTTGTDAGSLKTYTLVGLARVPGESASATLVQTVGAKPIVADAPTTPPIVSAGTVDIGGTFQVVTNPNSAGPGVPVSVWTRKDLDRQGTPNTCHFDEFIRFGAPNGGSGGPKFYPLPTGAAHATHGHKPIIVCDDCNCEGEHSISYYDNQGNSQSEGEDILDIETGTHEGKNHNVEVKDFPCDLFDFVFGTPAWENKVSVEDNFCETKLMTEDPDDSSKEIGADEAFLKTNAEEVKDCSTLGPSSTGVFWITDGANCDLPNETGTPYHPVILIIDGTLKATAQKNIYGLVFIRTDDGDIYAQDPNLDPATGGTATIEITGGVNVYGAMVVQGKVDKIKGTGAVVYSKDILEGFKGAPFEKMSSLPGSWTDRASY